MKNSNYIVRKEKQSEQRTVENLVRESFWNVYRPGAYEHYLLHSMRDDADFVPELNLVLEKEGTVIGQTAFVRSSVRLDDGRSLPTLTLGPIGIAPPYKRQGYGKYLLDYAFDRARDLGYGAVLFEGNIGFYGKCGCVPASRCGIRYHGLPAGEDAPFFLCRVLQDGYLDGISGEYAPPAVYLVAEQDVERFDREFPPKQKRKLPGQLF